MLTIRLKRVGKKKKPTYRFIINEKSKDPWGDFLDTLGTYNPHTKEIVVDIEKAKKYIANGAQMSVSVNNLFVSQGIVEGKKKTASRITNKRKKKLSDKVEAAEQEKAAAEVKATAEAEAAAQAPVEETPTEEVKEEKPVEATDDKPVEEVKEEVKE